MSRSVVEARQVDRRFRAAPASAGRSPALDPRSPFLACHAWPRSLGQGERTGRVAWRATTASSRLVSTIHHPPRPPVVHSRSPSLPLHLFDSHSPCPPSHPLRTPSPVQRPPAMEPNKQKPTFDIAVTSEDPSKKDDDKPKSSKPDATSKAVDGKKDDADELVSSGDTSPLSLALPFVRTR